MFIDRLYESLLVGGWLLLPIFLVGTWAFYLLISILYTIAADLLSSDSQEPLRWFRASLKDSAPIPRRWWCAPGYSFRLLEHILSLRDYPSEFIKASIQIYIKRTHQTMSRGLFFVGVLAALAPLLGLLGTVGGMMNTFTTITIYGNSNPVLMADGISEALITTQAGLLIAFPLLIFRNILEDKIATIDKRIERVSLQAIDELESAV